MSFIYCHLNFHANLLRPWRFPLIKVYGMSPTILNCLSSKEGRLGLLTYTHRSLHFNPNRPYCKIYFNPWQDN